MPYDLERLVERAVGDDGDDRTEDLLAHDGIVKCHAGKASGLDAQRFGIAMSAERHARVGVAVLDKPHHAVEVTAADHVRPLVAFQDIVAVVLVKTGLQLG